MSQSRLTAYFGMSQDNSASDSSDDGGEPSGLEGEADDERASSSSTTVTSGVKRKSSTGRPKSLVVKRTRTASNDGTDSSSSSTASKQRVRGVDPAWKEEFDWLEVIEEDSMVCTLCRKFSRRPQKCVPGKAIWVDVPCKTVRRSSLILHKDSKSHKEAVQMEVMLQASKRDGGIQRALDSVVSAQRKAFLGALKCMYFLNKREIAHTTNFVPLLNLAKSLGVQYLNDLYVGGNAAYRSERFVQEIVSALGEVIVKNITSAMQQSQFVVLMIDETTDVAVFNQLIIYGRYIHDGTVQTRFGTDS